MLPRFSPAADDAEKKRAGAVARAARLLSRRVSSSSPRVRSRVLGALLLAALLAALLLGAEALDAVRLRRSAVALPGGQAVPLLIVVPKGGRELLARTLTTLQRVDGIRGAPLVFALASGDKETAAQVAAVRWAATVVLPAALSPLAALWGVRSPGGATRRLLRFAFEVAGRSAAVILPAGLELSQDALDYYSWALTAVAASPSLATSTVAVNGFYDRGKPFGGDERYTLASRQAGLTPWGCALLRRHWPAVRAAWPWRGEGWEAAVASAVSAAGLGALTPRISRVRFTGVTVTGEDFQSYSEEEQRVMTELYIPDHPIVYGSEHPLILVERH